MLPTDPPVVQRTEQDGRHEKHGRKKGRGRLVAYDRDGDDGDDS